jgi:integrase
VANKTVNIYERVKVQGKWTDRSVPIPKLKADGTMYLKDDREGKFHISWYEGTSKKWHPKTCATLSEALRVKADKEWFVQNQNRPGVQDPTRPDVRVPISLAVNDYIDALTGAKATKKAHRHDLREFEAWNESLENNKKKKFVEEIDKAHMRRFFEYLVDDEPENCPFTAAWKLMRLNKFIRATLHLDAGKGPIKKSDFRRELKSGQTPPEIYTREELRSLFEIMTPDEVVLFELFLHSGLRKREVMFLEDDDLIVETLAPGFVKRQVRVTSKPRLGFMTKNGKTRFVPVERVLMNKLLAVKATKRASKLLFGTRTGLPDYHMLDTLRAIAKRSGMDDPTRCWLHKFRSTCATNWLRAKRLGGKGYDIGVVRDWLGHDDCKSIEAYIALVREEELIEPDEPEPSPSSTAKSVSTHTICLGCGCTEAELSTTFIGGSRIVFCPVCQDLVYEHDGKRTLLQKIDPV